MSPWKENDYRLDRGCKCRFGNRRKKPDKENDSQLYRNERMAPGSGSMLRSRRRDVNVKPNRVLDRNSSRGMIYENEELRLRTININAEVERGQHDIKKLRRENDQLRREIWSLREEYDRLEALLKCKKQQNDDDAEESEDEESDEKDEADQDNASNQEKVSNKDIDMLSVVEEEPEDNSTEGDGERMGHQQKRDTLSEGLPSPFLHIPEAFIDQSGNVPTNGVNTLPESIIPHQESTSRAPDASNNQGIPAVFPEDLEQLIRNCTFPVDPVEMYRPTGEPNHNNFMTMENNNLRSPRNSSQPTSGYNSNPLQPGMLDNAPEELPTASIPYITNRNGPVLSKDLRCQPYAGQSPSFLRLNCVHPHTVFFPVNSPEFSNLTVQEVIDALSEQISADLLGSLRGVRLVGGACYLSLATDGDAKALAAAAPSLRGARLRLEDASIGTAFIALSGVPHDVKDEAVAESLAQFGTVIGTVERRIYRGVDTGERLARLRPKLAIPRFLWFGGCRAILRLMKEEEISVLALARRKSFRSHLHIKLKTTEEPPSQVPPLPGERSRQNLGQTTVAQSVPNLVPVTSLSAAAPPFIGFSTTQSVPDLTIQPPPPDQAPKPQFFSSTTGASNNVFLFPPPDTPQGSPGSPYAIRRHSSIVPPSLGNTSNSHHQPHNGISGLGHPFIPNGIAHPPQSSNRPEDSGSGVPQAPHHQRSQSTPPVPNHNPSPLPTHRQNSQSDSEAPKPPDTPGSTKARRISRKVSKTGSQPNLAPLDTKKANGDASSSSGQDSPSKPSRRRASVYFKRPGSFRRHTSMEQMEGTTGELTTTCSERERSNSDVSSRTSGGCRRKMSETGREGGKVPWCGCWGNGCI